MIGSTILHYKILEKRKDNRQDLLRCKIYEIIGRLE